MLFSNAALVSLLVSNYCVYRLTLSLCSVGRGWCVRNQRWALLVVLITANLGAVHWLTTNNTSQWLQQSCLNGTIGCCFGLTVVNSNSNTHVGASWISDSDNSDKTTAGGTVSGFKDVDLQSKIPLQRHTSSNDSKGRYMCNYAVSDAYHQTHLLSSSCVRIPAGKKLNN